MYFELKNISVHYDKVQALENVTLHLEQGEIVALIGANGAGKTSTLRAITALARPSSGEIWFGGKRIDRLEPAAVVALGISMVPEGRHVYPFMSVKDNLLMGAYLRKDKGEIKQDLERIFTRFPRVKERLKQQAGSLSGGEQQMVVISRALMARPKLLLLDEPSLGLAPMVVRDIARAIVEINRDARHQRHSGRTEFTHGPQDLEPSLCAGNRPDRFGRQVRRSHERRSYPETLSRRMKTAKVSSAESYAQRLRTCESELFTLLSGFRRAAKTGRRAKSVLRESIDWEAGSL